LHSHANAQELLGFSIDFVFKRQSQAGFLYRSHRLTEISDAGKHEVRSVLKILRATADHRWYSKKLECVSQRHDVP
jgi:hypothetical protein